MMRACEGRGANGTLVGFVQGVRATMLLEVTGLLKSLVANVTNIWTLP